MKHRGIELDILKPTTVGPQDFVLQVCPSPFLTTAIRDAVVVRFNILGIVSMAPEDVENPDSSFSLHFKTPLTEEIRHRILCYVCGWIDSFGITKGITND